MKLNKSLCMFCQFVGILVLLAGCESNKTLDPGNTIKSGTSRVVVQKQLNAGSANIAAMRETESVRIESSISESRIVAVNTESDFKTSVSTIESNDFLLPKYRIIAYYGNPLSKRMGVLGEYPENTMLKKLNNEVKLWNKVDPDVKSIPALHLIAVVAQGDPGKSGKYRMIMPDKVTEEVYSLAKSNHALFFIDIQTGHDNIRNILPRFEWILKKPDVHIGIDPEFNLVKSGAKPGKKIGTYDAKDINYVTGYLQKLVEENHLPPKILVIHRFTRNGVTNAKKIILRQGVQIVMNMDGWGAPELKRGTYRNYIVPEPVQFTGFKIFYHNDTKAGDPLMTPSDLIKLKPEPYYVQYQ